jgi:hypothetical protein
MCSPTYAYVSGAHLFGHAQRVCTCVSLRMPAYACLCLPMPASACVCLRMPAYALAAYALATYALGTYAYASGAHLFRHAQRYSGPRLFRALSGTLVSTCACVRAIERPPPFFFRFPFFSWHSIPRMRTQILRLFFCRHVIKASGACAGPRIFFPFVFFFCWVFFLQVYAETTKALSSAQRVFELLESCPDIGLICMYV